MDESNKNTQQLTLTLGVTITVYLLNDEYITADAFRTTPAGIYLDRLTNVSPGIREKIHSAIKESHVIFYPYANIDFVVYDVNPKDVSEEELRDPHATQG